MAEPTQTARGFNQLLADFAKFIYAGEQYENQAFTYYHPDMVATVANDVEGKFDSAVVVGRGLGTIVHGPFSVYAAFESIRFGPKSMINPALEAYMGSSAQAPIPVLWPKPPYEIDVDKLGAAINQAVSVIKGSKTDGEAGWSGGTGGGNVNPSDILSQGAPIPPTYNSSQCVENLKKHFLTNLSKYGWTPADVDKMMAIGSRISGGKAPEVLAAVILSECGGNPRIPNPTSGAIGLIQFMPSTARALGTTSEAIAKMTISQQLDLTNTYFGSRTDLNTLGRAYAKVFYPAFLNGATIKAGQKAYDWNKGLDYNKDGVIDLNDLDAHLRKRIQGIC